MFNYISMYNKGYTEIILPYMRIVNFAGDGSYVFCFMPPVSSSSLRSSELGTFSLFKCDDLEHFLCLLICNLSSFFPFIFL